MAQLAGKVALITGAGQGVGQGIGLAFASEGVDVAVVGRTPEKLDRTCELLRERGVKAHPFVHDVADHDAVPGLVDSVVQTFGRIDILVNNAYTGSYGPMLTMSMEQFRRGYESAPLAAFALMQACHPHLAERGGDIVNVVTSAMVRWDPQGYGAYASAKQALRSLTRTVAAEWAADGIRANNIAPHALSPGLQRWVDAYPDEAEAFVRTIPAGRVGDCEQDIGRAVVALVGADLRYLTGATLPLDGGQAYFG